MSAAQEKILAMVAEGKLTAGEANELLRSLPPQGPGPWQLLFQPAARLATSTALAVGVLATVVALGLTRLGVSFDGAFDVHVPGTVSWPASLAQVVLAWPGVALLFWIAARVAGRPGRLVDMLAAVGLARAAFALLGLLSLPLRGLGPGQVPSPVQFAVIFAMLPVLVWAFTLLCTGFRTASGLRGARLVVSFLVALLVAEVATKLALLPLSP